ncbi:unnamed protein product [Calypogeia fissa]
MTKGSLSSEWGRNQQRQQPLLADMKKALEVWNSHQCRPSWVALESHHLDNHPSIGQLSISSAAVVWPREPFPSGVVDGFWFLELISLNSRYVDDDSYLRV